MWFALICHHKKLFHFLTLFLFEFGQSFREDKRTRVNESGNLDSEWVPLYDRGFSLTLSSEDSSAGPVRLIFQLTYWSINDIIILLL